MKSKKGTKKELSRRDFIKTTAVGVGATALAGLGAQEAKAQGTQDIQYELVTDVVVVGTGCGLAAAIEAKTHGADVLILEKNDWMGGLFLSAGGSCTMGGGTIVQQRAGVQDTVEQWYQDELYAHDYRCVPEIMRTLCERGADTIQWLENLGLVWGPLTAGVLTASPIRRGHAPAQSPNYVGGAGTPNSGIAWTMVMRKKVQELGIPALMKTRMTRIHREPNGPVVGVEAVSEGKTLNIKARKAVILCTGTWTDNYRMAQAWDPRIAGPDCYGDGGTPCDGKLYVDSAGDGHLAAAENGAGFSDMSFVAYLYIFYGTRSYWGWEPPIFDYTKENHNWRSSARSTLLNSTAKAQRAILVKNDGARWVNEALAGQPSVPSRAGLPENPEWPYPATYLSLPQPRNAWVVTDADGAAAMNWPMAEMQNPNPKGGLMLDPACVAIADSLADLAAKMNIPAAAFQATVSRYNDFVDAGKDEDFGKPMPMYKIAKPPFYAAKLSLIRHTQRNGLRVNTKCQVLAQADQRDGYIGRAIDGRVSIDKEEVIPHLYAAGEVGNVLGWRRPHNSLGHYITAARIAGENAAKELSLGR